MSCIGGFYILSDTNSEDNNSLVDQTDTPTQPTLPSNNTPIDLGDDTDAQSEFTVEAASLIRKHYRFSKNWQSYSISLSKYYYNNSSINIVDYKVEHTENGVRKSILITKPRATQEGYKPIGDNSYRFKENVSPQFNKLPEDRGSNIIETLIPSTLELVAENGSESNTIYRIAGENSTITTNSNNIIKRIQIHKNNTQINFKINNIDNTTVEPPSWADTP